MIETSTYEKQYILTLSEIDGFIALNEYELTEEFNYEAVIKIIISNYINLELSKITLDCSSPGLSKLDINFIKFESQFWFVDVTYKVSNTIDIVFADNLYKRLKHNQFIKEMIDLKSKGK